MTDVTNATHQQVSHFIAYNENIIIYPTRSGALRADNPVRSNSREKRFFSTRQTSS